MSKCFVGCENCPIGEDIRARKARLGEDYQPEYCSCDKVGEKHYCGVCEDAMENIENDTKHGYRRGGKAYRRKMTARKRKRRMEIAQNGFKPSLGYTHDDKYWTPSHRSRAQKWLKRQSNKKVRKSKTPRNHSGYRKMFDYNWNWY